MGEEKKGREEGERWECSRARERKKPGKIRERGR